MSDVVNINDFKKKKEDEGKAYLDKLVEEYEDEDHMLTDFAASVMADVVESLRDYDINVEDNVDCIKDIILSIEAIKGLMHRARGQHYAMSDLADSVCGDDSDVEELMNSFLNY